MAIKACQEKSQKMYLLKSIKHKTKNIVNKEKLENTPQDYKPKRITVVFNEKYIEYKSESSEKLSIEHYLKNMKSYLGNVIDELKNLDEWKIHLTKSDYIEIMIGNKTDGIINELFELPLSRHQIGLEVSIKGSEFVFDYIDGLHYKCNKIDLNRCGSYIDFPKWLKNKNATINPKNNDDKCFRYAIIAAQKNIGKHPEIIIKIKPYIDQYEWEEEPRD